MRYLPSIKPMAQAVMAATVVLMSMTAHAQGVNVNTGSVAELQQIKGIGPKTAERIIEERERAGLYESLEDFALRVKGIGEKRALKMQEEGLRFDETATAQDAEATAPIDLSQIDTSYLIKP